MLPKFNFLILKVKKNICERNLYKLQSKPVAERDQ